MRVPWTDRHVDRSADRRHTDLCQRRKDGQPARTRSVPHRYDRVWRNARPAVWREAHSAVRLHPVHVQRQGRQRSTPAPRLPAASRVGAVPAARQSSGGCAGQIRFGGQRGVICIGIPPGALASGGFPFGDRYLLTFLPSALPHPSS